MAAKGKVYRKREFGTQTDSCYQDGMSAPCMQDEEKVDRLRLLQQEAEMASLAQQPSQLIRFLLVWFVLSVSLAIGAILGMLNYSS